MISRSFRPMAHAVRGVFWTSTRAAPSGEGDDMRTLAGILIATAFLAAACGGSATQTSSSGTTVTATLKDNGIELDQHSTASGTVTFKVVNAGSVMHSLILLKTDVAHDKIASDPKDASKVDPTGLLRETGQIAIGQTVGF